MSFEIPRVYLRENVITGQVYAEIWQKGEKPAILLPQKIFSQATGSNYTAQQLRWLSKDFKAQALPHALFQIEWLVGRPQALTLHCKTGLNGGGLEFKKEINPYLTEAGSGWRHLTYHPEVALKKILAKASQPQNYTFPEVKPAEKHPYHPWQMQPHLLDSNQKKQWEAFLSHAWSFERYMGEALYGKHGYYSSGTVNFQQFSAIQLAILAANPTVSLYTGDFSTAATFDPCLAFQLATHSFEMWKAMRQSGDIAKGERFTICEFGGGKGQLANNVLTLVEKLAQTSPQWSEFNQVVRYKMGEISPSLRKIQAKENEKWIQLKKLEVLEANACDLAKTFKPRSIKGVIFSNELIDAFPTHEVMLNEKGQLLVSTLIPTYTDPKKLDPQFTNASDVLKAQFSSLLDGETLKSRIVLSCKDIEKLPQELLPELEWHRTYLPAELFPTVMRFAEKCGRDYFANLPPLTPAYINTSISDYMEGVAQILDKGFVITVDYGSHHADVPDRKVRTYARDKIPDAECNPGNEFFKWFGKADLTVSMNASLVDLAGRQAGLETLAYAPQKALSDVQKDLTEAASVFKDMRGRFEDFKVLIQEKRGACAPFALPANLEPVSFSELYHQTHERIGIVNTGRLVGRALFDCLRHQEQLPFTEESFFAYCQEMYDVQLIAKEEAIQLIQLIQMHPSAKLIEIIQNKKDEELSPTTKRLFVEVCKTLEILAKELR